MLSLHAPRPQSLQREEHCFHRPATFSGRGMESLIQRQMFGPSHRFEGKSMPCPSGKNIRRCGGPQQVAQIDLHPSVERTGEVWVFLECKEACENTELPSLNPKAHLPGGEWIRMARKQECRPVRVARRNERGNRSYRPSSRGGYLTSVVTSARTCSALIF
jgi:hypothetical protein